MVITATAGARRLPNRFSREMKSGQVATTSIVAHTVAARNGRRTHSDPTISIKRQMTARVVRVRSWRTVLMKKSSCRRAEPSPASPGAADGQSPDTCSLTRRAWRFSVEILSASSAVRRPKRSRTRAMRPVQPVWWLAPRPAPLSPWKYS